MYVRTSNNLVVLGIAGIVVVMSVFTWVMYGVFKQVVFMTDLMDKMARDVHVMVEVQQNMTTMSNNMGIMAQNMVDMNASMQRIQQDTGMMVGNTYNMNANVARMGQDVGRSSYIMSSPMNYMRNMSPW